MVSVSPSYDCLGTNLSAARNAAAFHSSRGCGWMKLCLPYYYYYPFLCSTQSAFIHITTTMETAYVSQGTAIEKVRQTVSRCFVVCIIPPYRNHTYLCTSSDHQGSHHAPFHPCTTVSHVCWSLYFSLINIL